MCVTLLGLFPTLSHLLRGLPHRWKLHVFNVLIFNVSQSIKVFFFIPAHHWPFSQGFAVSEAAPLPLHHLCTPSYPPAARPADSGGFLMGSDGLRALITSGVRQVRRGV